MRPWDSRRGIKEDGGQKEGGGPGSSLASPVELDSRVGKHKMEPQHWHGRHSISCLRSSFPMPSGSSRERLNPQLMAPIPGTDMGILILLSIFPHIWPTSLQDSRESCG